jgi:hypothetical protein
MRSASRQAATMSVSVIPGLIFPAAASAPMARSAGMAGSGTPSWSAKT